MFGDLVWGICCLNNLFDSFEFKISILRLCLLVWVFIGLMYIYLWIKWIRYLLMDLRCIVDEIGDILLDVIIFYLY